MQFSINHVTLVGNLARDPELKFTQNGNAVCTFAVATSRGVKNGDKWDNVATFHNIVCWQKLAENVGANYEKGDKVFIEGRIENRSYTDKQGNKKYTSEVIAESVIGFGSRTAQAAKAALVDRPTDDGQEPPDDFITTTSEDIANDVPF